ncbi:hypothetical protein N9271_02930 [Pseudomonadales bacterium]|nr:hypothetical protein [Pseudomonadales bacterium]
MSPLRKCCQAYRLFFICVALLSIGACQSHSYNETVYPFLINDEQIDTSKPKRLIISHENFGAPSKNYLQAYERKIDAVVEETLKKNNYTIINNSDYRKFWREAKRKHGSPYNASTSQVNATAFQLVVRQTLNKLKEANIADAIIFTDLVEQPVVFQGNNNHLAKWHGVSRRPGVKGSGAVSTEFDWSQSVPAASLRIIIYDIDGKLLFKSIGGLEVTRYIDTRKVSGRFARRDKLFTKSSNIYEGVALALHPFIVAEGYPRQ